MAAGPYLHVFIITLGVRLATVWVQPRGRYRTSPGFITNVTGNVEPARGYLFKSILASKLSRALLHSREPLVSV